MECGRGVVRRGVVRRGRLLGWADEQGGEERRARRGRGSVHALGVHVGRSGIGRVLRGPNWDGVLETLGLPITSAWQGVLVAVVGGAIGALMGRRLASRQA